MPLSDLWAAYDPEQPPESPEDLEKELEKFERSRRTAKAREAALKSAWKRKHEKQEAEKPTWASILQGEYLTTRLYHLGTQDKNYQKMAAERARCVYSVVTHGFARMFSSLQLWYDIKHHIQ